MQRNYRFMLFAALAGVAACATDVTQPVTPGIQVAYSKGGNGVGVVVTPSSATIAVGSTLQLSAEVSTDKTVQDGRSVTWSSTNEAIATVSPSGLVTGVSAGGPVTITAATGGKKAVSGSALITVRMSAPAWSTLVSEANAPGAPIFWSTNAPTDNALYAILGNGDYQPFTLWKFDLTTDTWSEISTTGYPLGSYRQIVHDPVMHRILTFWDGRGQVYSVPETGGAWEAVGSTANSGSYYEGASFWNAVSGKLNSFGGYGGFSFNNALGSFDPLTATWTPENQSALKPGPRMGPANAVDETGNVFLVTSGQGTLSGSQADGTHVYDDLWRLDLNTNSWTQLIADDNAPGATYGPGMDFVPSLHSVYRFGGNRGLGSSNYINALERADVNAASPVWEAVATTGISPSPRYIPGVFFDAPRNRLLVIGGQLVVGGVKLDVHSLAFQ